MSPRTGITAAAVALACAGAAGADGRGPEAQFWMDVATISMSMPGVSAEMMEGAGAFGGMFGGGRFGATKGMGGSPGKWLDSALYVRARPNGIEGSHGIPAEMNLGASLPLLPVEAERAQAGTERDDEYGEKPKGRLLFYWGCGENVRAGQPKILDFARLGEKDYGRFMAGRSTPDRGAKNQPGRSVWPNKTDSRRVPKDASLQGAHAVAGDAVPASLKFQIGAVQDFLAAIDMSAQGDLKESVLVTWNAVPNARAYFLNAMGAKRDGDMIVWSSSEEPDPGWGLLNYLPPAQIDRFLKDKVILPASVQQCAVPQGIFEGVDGAMSNMIAYGQELNLSHPPKPPKAAAGWQPEWTAKVRVKSTGMTMLGAAARGERGERRKAAREEGGGEKDAVGGMPPIPNVNDAVNVIKGIFGR